MNVIRHTVAVLFSALAINAAHAADGLITVKSQHSATETASRLTAALQERGLKLFARVDHAAGAASIGQKLRPTEVFIFGNPQGGTPLLDCRRTTGIDLPLKALIWQDDDDQVWFAYNDPVWIARRHGAGDCPIVPKLGQAMSGLAEAATAR